MLNAHWHSQSMCPVGRCREDKIAALGGHDLVRKLGHLHLETMIRSHVKTEPSKILGVDVQSWEGFLAGWGWG